ncbi:MAG: YihY/virulence factor BrkB family protein [Rhodospirillales bacterium]|nr:YihY/virulence factor BrkB family protein [Rhodospirillales bacterium]
MDRSGTLRRWRRVGLATLAEARSDRISLAAAGCAFYATLALFPAMSTLIFLYGLVFDPISIEAQLQLLARLLPPPTYALIDQELHQLVAHRNGTLGIGLAVSVTVAFWSAATGTKSVLSALNMAYDQTETRGFLRFQAVALAMTFCAMLGAVLAIALLVFLPAALSYLHLSSARVGVLIHWGGIAVMLGFVGQALALLYRFGPGRRPHQDRRIAPGALLALVLWLIASALLSFYVGHIARFDVTYGPIGAVVGVMLWFYVTVYAVLLGAELNAQLERLIPRGAASFLAAQAAEPRDQGGG